MRVRGLAQLVVPARKSDLLSLGESEGTSEVDGIVRTKRVVAGCLGGSLDQRVRHFVNVERRPDRVQLGQSGPTLCRREPVAFSHSRYR